MKKIMDKTGLVSFLKTISYFQTLPTPILTTLALQFQEKFIRSGSCLIKQGDVGDCLYIVQSGKLLVIRTSEKATEEWLGDIHQGGLVGELALFTQAPRAASVLAVRDSVLWALPKTDFDAFVEKNPQHIMPMVKAAMLRLSHPVKRTKGKLTTLTLAKASCTPVSTSVINAIKDEFNRVGRTLYLNSHVIKSQFKDINFDSTSDEHYTNTTVINWLNEQETRYQYVIYETDDTLTRWTKCCLRQADAILLIADAMEKPQLGPIASALVNPGKPLRTPLKLLLIHHASVSLPQNTRNWLGLIESEIIHLKEGRREDIQRVVRLLLGKGIALVLGGGGAKGLGHLGVYKALCELHIPIDRVCGTSMGALIGALIAMDMPLESIINALSVYIIKNKKIYDYTLPLIAILNGQGSLEACKNIYGQTHCIEDLWKNFFCIASNYTQRKMDVLHTGLIYKAIRASSSLPGIVPPISNEHDELLIDGGIFNNIPVDIMKKRASPCQIIAVRVSPFCKVHATIPDGICSGFKHYFHRFLKKHTRLLPNLGEIISSTITLCNDEKELAQLASANVAIDVNLGEFGLLEFDKIESIIDKSYEQAMRVFEKTPPNLTA